MQCGRVWQCCVMQGSAWIIRRGDAMRGSVGQGTVWPCVDSLVRSGVLRFVAVLHGDGYKARKGKAGRSAASHGEAWVIWPGWAG